MGKEDIPFRTLYTYQKRIFIEERTSDRRQYKKKKGCHSIQIKILTKVIGLLYFGQIKKWGDSLFLLSLPPYTCVVLPKPTLVVPLTPGFRVGDGTTKGRGRKTRDVNQVP